MEDVNSRITDTLIELGRQAERKALRSVEPIPGHTPAEVPHSKGGGAVNDPRRSQGIPHAYIMTMAALVGDGTAWRAEGCPVSTDVDSQSLADVIAQTNMQPADASKLYKHAIHAVKTHDPDYFKNFLDQHGDRLHLTAQQRDALNVQVKDLNNLAVAYQEVAATMGAQDPSQPVHRAPKMANHGSASPHKEENKERGEVKLHGLEDAITTTHEAARAAGEKGRTGKSSGGEMNKEDALAFINKNPKISDSVKADFAEDGIFSMNCRDGRTVKIDLNDGLSAKERTTLTQLANNGDLRNLVSGASVSATSHQASAPTRDSGGRAH